MNSAIIDEGCRGYVGIRAYYETAKQVTTKYTEVIIVAVSQDKITIAAPGDCAVVEGKWKQASLG